MMRRRGGWLQTHSGRRFYPGDPRPGDFDPEDIAHGLAHTCRFNGQTREFYSVAQHSVHVSRLVRPGLKLAALMHDAAEAYIGDVVRPLKALLPDYRQIEIAVERAIAEQFDLPYPWHPEIHEADATILMTEKRDLLAVDLQWPRRETPLPENLTPWPPYEAKAQWLWAYRYLSTLGETKT